MAQKCRTPTINFWLQNLNFFGTFRINFAFAHLFGHPKNREMLNCRSATPFAQTGEQGQGAVDPHRVLLRGPVVAVELALAQVDPDRGLYRVNGRPG